MLKNPPKTVLTSRVEPELKEQLGAEAAQCDMTLSNYTEYCLRHFNSVLYDHQVSEEQNDILTKRLNILELANQRLTELNEERASENQDLSEQLRIYKKRVEALWITFLIVKRSKKVRVIKSVSYRNL